MPIDFCTAGSADSSVRMPPRWSQAITIIDPEVSQICW